jgi:hypothetical protein
MGGLFFHQPVHGDSIANIANIAKIANFNRRLSERAPSRVPQSGYSDSAVSFANVGNFGNVGNVGNDEGARVV